MKNRALFVGLLSVVISADVGAIKPKRTAGDSCLSELSQEMQTLGRQSREMLKKMFAQEQVPVVTEDEKTITITVPASDVKDVEEISIITEDGIVNANIPLKNGAFKVTIDEQSFAASAYSLVEQQEKQADGKEVFIDQRSSEYKTIESLPARIDIASIKSQYDEENKIVSIVFSKKEAKKVPVTVSRIATNVKEQKNQDRANEQKPVSFSLVVDDEK